MTPQQHLAIAEDLLTQGQTGDLPGDFYVNQAAALTALAHACIAIGDLLGAPHSGPAAGVADAVSK